MNAAKTEYLVSQLKYEIKPRRRLRQPDGPWGRMQKLRKSLTALFKFERLEMNYDRADETRGYAERLISEAVRHGPTHQETMDMANYWILEKQLIHKLFKVFVPRYQNYTTSYANIYKVKALPMPSYPKKSILELKGNVYPTLDVFNKTGPYLLHNMLLNAARNAAKKQNNKGKTQSTN